MFDEFSLVGFIDDFRDIFEVRGGERTLEMGFLFVAFRGEVEKASFFRGVALFEEIAAVFFREGVGTMRFEGTLIL